MRSGSTVGAIEGEGALPDRSYLTKRELCQRTGLSAPTIHRYKRAGKIPFFQPGGKGARVLFPPDAIEAAQTQTNLERAEPPSGIEARRSRPGPQPKWCGGRDA